MKNHFEIPFENETISEPYIVNHPPICFAPQRRRYRAGLVTTSLGEVQQDLMTGSWRK
jgi:hypothetical protein